MFLAIRYTFAVTSYLIKYNIYIFNKYSEYIYIFNFKFIFILI